MKIAIDGPAGAGKSTISKQIAKDLGYTYIDTGAMYRTVGLYALNNNIDIVLEPTKIVDMLDDLKIDITSDENGQNMFLNGQNVTDLIRTEEVSMAASNVAVIKEVREKLVELQRNIASNQNVVMDGRDIGTNVLTNAECKIFLTASVLARGTRRFLQLKESGVDGILEDICTDIEKRDKNDSSRKVNPLKQAEDAVLLDTTNLTLEQSILAAKEIINKKLEDVK